VNKYEYNEADHRVFIDLKIQLAVRPCIIFPFSSVSTWRQKDQ